MPRPELIILDLDGTLVDSQYDLVKAFNEGLAAVGVAPRPHTEVVKFVGTGTGVHLKATLQKEPGIDVAAGMHAYEEAYLLCLAETTRLYAGMEATLEALKGTPLVVLTNKVDRFTRPLLDRLELTSRFVGIYGRDAFPVHKPDPGAVRSVCERHRVAVDRAVMIGDTQVDIMAGRTAGARTIGVTYGYGSEDELRRAGADDIVGSPAALVPLLT